VYEINSKNDSWKPQKMINKDGNRNKQKNKKILSIQKLVFHILGFANNDLNSVEYVFSLLDLTDQVNSRDMLIKKKH
jgi:hypothetical protein